MIHTFESYRNRKMVSPWLIDQPIGSGAFGTVYSVYKAKKTSESEYAVKIIQSTNEGISCLSEAVVMKCLQHPHLNSAIDILVEPERICIFQQRAKGSLDNYIKDSTLETKRKWGFQIASAVKYLSTLNLIHGDIKTSNILLYPDGNIKLSDFGLITKINKDTKRKVYTRTHRPPEVWSDSALKLNSDVWALGATLFELYTDQTVVPSEVENYQQAKPFLDSILDKLSDLPKDLIEVLEKCLVPTEIRWSIHQLMELDYFKDYLYKPGSIVSLTLDTKLKNYTKYIDGTYEELKDKINYIANSLIKFKTKVVPKFTDEYKVGLATILVYKLNNIKIPSKYNSSIWLKLEREVCSYLDFVLWI